MFVELELCMYMTKATNFIMCCCKRFESIIFVFVCIRPRPHMTYVTQGDL